MKITNKASNIAKHELKLYFTVVNEAFGLTWTYSPTLKRDYQLLNSLLYINEVRT